LKILNLNGNFGDQRRGRHARTPPRPGTAALLAHTPRAVECGDKSPLFCQGAASASTEETGRQVSQFLEQLPKSYLPPRSGRKVKPSESRPIKVKFFYAAHANQIRPPFATASLLVAPPQIQVNRAKSSPIQPSNARRSLEFLLVGFCGNPKNWCQFAQFVSTSFGFGDRPVRLADRNHLRGAPLLLPCH